MMFELIFEIVFEVSFLFSYDKLSLDHARELRAYASILTHLRSVLTRLRPALCSELKHLCSVLIRLCSALTAQSAVAAQSADLFFKSVRFSCENSWWSLAGRIDSCSAKCMLVDLTVSLWSWRKWLTAQSFVVLRRRAPCTCSLTLSTYGAERRAGAERRTFFKKSLRFSCESLW